MIKNFIGSMLSGGTIAATSGKSLITLKRPKSGLTKTLPTIFTGRRGMWNKWC